MQDKGVNRPTKRYDLRRIWVGLKGWGKEKTRGLREGRGVRYAGFRYPHYRIQATDDHTHLFVVEDVEIGH